MTRIPFVPILLVAAIVIMTGSRPVAAQEAPLEAVRFLVGCWAQPAPEGSGLREMYASPAENMMTGLSQFWRDGRIVDFEFHRIDASTNGPVLTPHPRGAASVSFQPTDSGPNYIVWSNPDHDFPQQIGYRLTPGDTLVSRIEGPQAGTVRSVEWRMARVDCP